MAIEGIREQKELLTLQEKIRLVALFMTYETMFGLAWRSPTELNVRDLTRVPLNEHDISQMKYHTSYDWLMPVAKKCVDIATWDGSDGEELQKQIQFELSEFNDIKEVFEVVVDFIMWYNHQQEVAYMESQADSFINIQKDQEN